MVANDHKDLLDALEFQQQEKFEQAIPKLQGYLERNPDNPVALYSLALSFMRLGDSRRALAQLDHGVLVNSTYSPLWLIRAATLQNLGDKLGALASYDKAIELNPKYTEALINSGALLRDMFRHQESLERFNRVLEIDPNHQSALANTGIILTEFKQSELAIKMFERLLAINPDYDYAPGLLSYEKLHACDWTGFYEARQKIIDGVREGKRSTKTLAFMAISDEAQDHHRCARTFAQHFCPEAPASLWSGERYGHSKMRIAYVSPDLREHPVGHLLAGVIEKHDKSRFELIGISIGIDDHSRIRTRMKSAFDRFVDAKDMTARQIAQLMRDMEVDIAIDLAGYTSDSKTEIFAWRPAPVQVNYLGYPGTMGVPYMDYILADRHVIPEEHKRFYDEKVAYLPHAYLPTDDSLKISDRTPTRAECGLPDDGVVFCCFSHDYKITPPIFDVWMRLLNKVPGSVLWLAAKSELSRGNLRKEAANRGVAPERLVFADRVPLVEDHFARYRQADMFLDTHPYNAHTTAADALMSGLPVITFWGNAFPARVAGSLLHAAGLPELVADSVEDYEALAFRLATDSALLAAIKAKLAGIGRRSHLFDTEAFCRGLEAVYQEMYQSRLSDTQAPEPLKSEESGAVVTPKVQSSRRVLLDHQVKIAIPVYRAQLSGYEEFSFTRSIPFLEGRSVELLAPEDLDVRWYLERCSFARVRRFDARYFASIKGYNELLLSRPFYASFKPSEYVLILQTDAMLLSGDIDSWLKRGFDYIGAPWPKGVEVFVNAGRFEGEFGKRVRAHVGNGGFSLRRIDKCIQLLKEFEVLREVFVKTGSSEDLFFSLLGGLSADFVIPNEITASYFSLELEPQYYFHVNGNHMPLGAHAWWKHNPDFWRSHGIPVIDPAS